MNVIHKQSLWIPSISMIVALAGVISGVLIQYMNMQKEIQLKKYEVTYLERRESFMSYTKELTETVKNVLRNCHVAELFENQIKLDQIYYGMYPFFDEEEKKSGSIRKMTIDFVVKCEGVLLHVNPEDADEKFRRLNPDKEELIMLLYEKLFTGVTPMFGKNNEKKKHKSTSRDD